jgi:arsenite methyltransferase
MALDTERLREEISKVYSEVARDPKKGYHFHTGREYATERLGYERAALAELPDAVTAPFAGVGNPLAMGAPRPGETVVDIGAGSGMDTFLAAGSVGLTGRVIAVDMTDVMLKRGRDNAALTGLRQIEYREGWAEALPVSDANVDLVISNGVINLSPDKDAAFREAFRVLKPGGRMQIADIVVHKDIPPAAREDIAIWTA